MLEFPIKRTIIIDDTKKKKRGRKQKADGEKMLINGKIWLSWNHRPKRRRLNAFWEAITK